MYLFMDVSPLKPYNQSLSICCGRMSQTLISVMPFSKAAFMWFTAILPQPISAYFAAASDFRPPTSDFPDFYKNICAKL